MRVQSNKMISVFVMMLLFWGLVLGCSPQDNNPKKAGDTGKAESKDEKPAPQGNAKSGDNIQLRVSWWGSQNRHDRTLKAIEIFEKKNPNIKVSAEFLGWDGYWQKMATAAASKNLPDIMQMDDAYLADYVSRGLLVDLNPYTKSGVLNLKDVDESFLIGGKLDNKLYALNLGANAVALAYDPAMFQKAGVPELKSGFTWDDYADTAKKLKEKLGDGVYGTMLSDGVNEFKQYLMEKGAYLYNNDGTSLGYDNDQYVIDWFNYWLKLKKDGIAPGPDVTGQLLALEDQLIVHGKSPFLTLHSNQVVAVRKAANRPIKLTVYPSDPNGKKPQYLKPSQYFSLTSHSKQAEAAVKFIDFVTNDLEANDILGGERGVPISSKVREHLLPKLEDSAKESFNYIDYVSKNFPPLSYKDPAGAGEINETLYKRIQDAVNYGQITSEQAAKQFRDEATKILKSNKK